MLQNEFEILKIGWDRNGLKIGWDRNGLKKYFPIVISMGLFLVVQYPIGDLHAKFQPDG